MRKPTAEAVTLHAVVRPLDLDWHGLWRRVELHEEPLHEVLTADQKMAQIFRFGPRHFALERREMILEEVPEEHGVIGGQSQLHGALAARDVGKLQPR